MLGAIIEKTRLGGEQVGNGMKTIISRIYQSKSIDPDVTDEDLSKMSAMLSKLGVQVRDTTGAYRPLNDILKDIADKEKGMTDTQIMAINTQASGVRQANIFATALDTVGKSQDLANKGLNSNGELQDANNKYLDTAAAKWTILGATITAMWQNMVSTDGIKGLIDGLTKFVQIFGNLKSVIMVATTALLLFKGVAIEKAMTSFAISMASVIFDVGVMTSVTKGATLAMNNLKIAFTENPLGWVALGITAIVSAVMIFNNHTDETIKKQQELRDQMSQVADEYKASMTEVDGLNKLLSEQQAIQSKDQSKLTADEKTRLHDIEVQLAGAIPNATTAYDNENKAMAENLDLTKKLVAMKLEEAKGKALEVVSSVNPDDELAKLKKAKAYKDTTEELMTQKGDEGGSDLRYKTLNSGLAWTQAQEKEIKNTKDQTAVLQFLATAHAGYDKEVTSGTKSLNDYKYGCRFHY